MDLVPVSNTTSCELLQRLVSGDKENAWREFVARYGGLVRGFSQRQGLQSADCDDVLQEVLLGVSRAMPGFEYDPTRGKFRSYLKTVTIHAVSKVRCQSGGQVSLEQIEEATRTALDSAEVETNWEDEWRKHHVTRAMRVIEAAFNEADVAAFRAYAIEGGEAQDVAAALGLSVGQVYQAKSRILKRLGEVVQGQVEEEG
jgi:RNA polymerase sigma factor (sigma-70 family)